MIRLRKGIKPQILIDNERKWTLEYGNAVTNCSLTDTIRYRYRHPDIKKALREEAYNKCMYCEQNIATGEIDHFIPISVDYHKIVDWDNLGLCCKECNRYKSDYYSLIEPLINPFQDEPEDHIFFYGLMTFPKVGDRKGTRTIERIKLTRTELLEARKEKIESIRRLIEQWNSLPDGQDKEMFKNMILKEAEKDKEFSATIRAFIYQYIGI